jgi:hypothetical protein
MLIGPNIYTSANATPEARSIFNRVVELLKQRANIRETMGYGRIYDILKLPAGDNARRQAGQLLGEISEYMHQNGKPMLTAIVVAQKTKKPGPGFADCAIYLKRLAANATEEEKERFWRFEVNRVFATAW